MTTTLTTSDANTRSRALFSIGFLSIVCLIPMIRVGQDLLSARSVFELYPVLFLPLFIRSRTEPETISNFKKTILTFLPGTLFVIFGIAFQRLSLVWIGSFWNIISVIHLGGIRFAWPAPFLIFAIPPITGFGSLFVGYKLRLIVTEIAVQFIQLVDKGSIAVGNQILFHGEWFLVDRVCEGMKMGLASILIGAAFALRSDRSGATVIGFALLPLWFFSNLCRICFLVLFQIPAGTWRHEFIGVILFVCGVVVPLAILSLIFPNRDQKEFNFSNVVLRSPSKILWLILPLLTIGFLFSNRLIPIKTHSWPAQINTFQLDADSTLKDPRIAVYVSGENYLILKRELFAVGTGHDPRICFEAVGFSFTEQGADNGISRGQLKSPSGAKPILLWWFSITEKNTLDEAGLANIENHAPRRSTSDLDWRWKRFLGADVIQWNLYGPNENELYRIAKTISKDPI
ncbi:exosortase N [Leptospira barantonii]|uniref:Exosortase N n=1 Tax=Leptospira barantonii TaxID=2023184 RepID=A0ABX4NQB5_9LEPT|nr:exosortase N [Leptospira barantonii]PJZ59030.1 exosortase N [Leptospira barantonii]